MIRKTRGGTKVIIKVLPSDVSKLRDEEVIIVNRVRLNARLVSLEMQNVDNNNQENILLIRQAIGGMMVQEKERKRALPGAKMTVRDVKKIFPDMDSMPKNSFAKVVL